MRRLIDWFLSFFRQDSPTASYPDAPGEDVPDDAPGEDVPDDVPGITPDCIELIKHFEGLRLDAYLDTASVPTIGYGDTGPHVQLGQSITPEEAERRLLARLEDEFVPGVLAALTVQPRPHELDAMVSLAYNVGVAAVAGSTLVRRFNARDPDTSTEFARWQFAGGISLRGLRRRREAERLRFLGYGASLAIAESFAVA